METKKLMIAGSIGLAIALLVNNSASAITGSETETLPEGSNAGSGPAGGAGFPLKRGAKGQYVRNLQKWLGVAIDGVFGPITETALKRKTGSPVVLSLAALNALMSGGAVATGSSAAVPISQAEQQAAALYTACFQTKNVPVFSGDPKNPVQTSTRAIASFRVTPDYAAILRVVNGSTDAQLRTIGGIYLARYGTLTSGGFGHTLDHWNSTALKLYGLWTARVRLSSLNL